MQKKFTELSIEAAMKPYMYTLTLYTPTIPLIPGPHLIHTTPAPYDVPS